MFQTEEKMVNACVRVLNDKYDNIDIVLEPNGLFGIPDIMINSSNITSIEAKLKNWKRALIQAYRYRSFSQKSFVFMDNDFIKAPLENIEEFKKYNIGLGSVTEEKITIYFEPKECEPFSEQLYEKALQTFCNNK